MINLTRAAKLRELAIFERLVYQYERKYRRLFASEFNRQAIALEAAYPTTQGVLSQGEKKLKALYENMFEEVAHVFASRALGLTRKHDNRVLETKAKKRPITSTAEEVTAQIAARARKRAAAKVVDITKTTATRIRKAVARGLEGNKSPREIARMIREDTGDEIAGWRAHTIARTETHSAAMEGEMMQMQADGIATGKEWISTNDEHTREAHREADGQVVAMDEDFQVDGEGLAYPGDAEGSPENVINCRCVLGFKVG